MLAFRLSKSHSIVNKLHVRCNRKKEQNILKHFRKVPLNTVVNQMYLFVVNIFTHRRFNLNVVLFALDTVKSKPKRCDNERENNLNKCVHNYKETFLRELSEFLGNYKIEIRMFLHLRTYLFIYVIYGIVNFLRYILVHR